MTKTMFALMLVLAMSVGAIASQPVQAASANQADYSTMGAAAAGGGGH